MKEEVDAAVIFITRMVKKNETISAEQLDKFSSQLTSVLMQKFKNHWYVEEPNKGQGYRCIRINETTRKDPVLDTAAKESGLKYEDLKLPAELTLWVDPNEVTCRFGELKGSYCTLMEGCKDNKSKSVDLEGLIKRSQELKKHEIKKITQHATTRRNKTNPVKAKHNMHNIHHKHSAGKPHFMNFPVYFYQQPNHQPTDRYHWVRGADLVMV